VRDILFRRYSTKLLTRAEYVRATTLFNSQFNAAADDLARRNVVASWLEDLAALHVG
jgi:phage FluMu gp28-like protein